MSCSTSPRRRAILAGCLLLFTSSRTWAAVPVWEEFACDLGRAALRWLSGSTTLGSMHQNLSMARKDGCAGDPQGQTRCEPTRSPKSGCSIDPQGKPVCTP
jgi:hypothetical protein